MLNNRTIKWAWSVEDGTVSPVGPLSAVQKAVLINLMTYANWKTCAAYPGVARISLDTGYRERAIRNALQDLCRIGYLTLITKGRRGQGKGKGRLANKYRVNIPAELIPVKYRHDVPENNPAFTGTSERIYRHETTYLPAPGAAQDSKEDSKEDNNPRNAPDGALASLSSEAKRIRAKATRRGVKAAVIDDAIQNETPDRIRDILKDLEAWPKLNHQNASGAFTKIRASKTEQAGKYPPLPKDGGGLARYATKHGLPQAKPGEDTWPYRERLQVVIRQLEDQDGLSIH
jgi:hypothetical protein